MSFLAAATGTAVAGLYLRYKHKEGIKAKNIETLEQLRMARLLKVQKEFSAQTFDLETDLISKLSKQAQVATVAECDKLPPSQQQERFYDAKVCTSHYAHWIDRVHNKDVLSFPQIIVRVHCEKDIQVCFDFVCKHHMAVSVAAGCHSANAMVDGCFTIDLAQMTRMEFDDAKQEVQVQAGSTLHALDAFCRAKGRLVPVGTNGDTGVSGLTLSGGMGWFTRKFGFTVDHLVGIDIVLPTGQFLKNVREDSPHADLLWACRGSGGGFGIVTNFYFQTHPMPNDEQFLLGTVVSLCPTTSMKQTVVKSWWQKLNSCSNETMSILVLPAAPVVPQLWVHYGPEASQGKKAITLVPELQAASKSGGGLFDVENSWKVIGHPKLQTLIAENQKHGYIYQSMVALTDMSDQVIDCLVEAIDKAPSSKCALIVIPVGGKSSTNDTPDCQKCSLSTRHAKVWILIEAIWDPAADGPIAGQKASCAWVRTFVKDINHKCGPCIAHTTHAFSDVRDENAGQGNNILVDVTKKEVAKRLKAIKSKVDPTNILRNNRQLSTNHATKETNGDGKN